MTIYELVNALAAIKLLKANLRGLQMCKMTLSQVLEPEDTKAFQ